MFGMAKTTWQARPWSATKKDISRGTSITQNSGVSKIDQHADQRGEHTVFITPPRCLAVMKSLETPA
jgi:hypothetical protein